MTKKTAATVPQKQERNGNPDPSPQTRFKPGQSGNPGGKPTGARNALTKAFIEAMSEDFSANGKSAIEKVRTADPSAYLRVIASIVPKEITVDRPLDGLSDDELSAAIDWVREKLAKLETAAGGAGTKH